MIVEVPWHNKLCCDPSRISHSYPYILCIWMVKLLCFTSFFLCKLSKCLFLCLQDLGMEEQLRRRGLLFRFVSQHSSVKKFDKIDV